jgi:hypothetical protein
VNHYNKQRVGAMPFSVKETLGASSFFFFITTGAVAGLVFSYAICDP